MIRNNENELRKDFTRFFFYFQIDTNSERYVTLKNLIFFI